jgi:hypothetical protein
MAGAVPTDAGNDSVSPDAGGNYHIRNQEIVEEALLAGCRGTSSVDRHFLCDALLALEGG